MAEDTTVTTGASGTTVKTGDTSVTTEIIKPLGIKEYILYKLDRTIAIVGLIAIGIYALYRGTTEGMQITIAVAGVLGGYIGGRTGN